MDDIDMLPVYLDKIKKQIKKDIDIDLKKYSLSNMHGMHLMCLYKNSNGLTLNELTERIKIDKANTTRAITDLMLKGYVTKDNKIRGYKVILTPKGLEIASLFYNHHHRRMKQILEIFNNQEKKQMLSFLKRIINKLDEENENEENFKNS